MNLRAKSLISAILIFLIPYSLSFAYNEKEEMAIRAIHRWQMSEAEDIILSIQTPSPYLVGIYEFNRGNYSKAYEALKKSSHKSKLQNLTEKLSAYEKIFEEKSSKYFKVRYTGQDRILAEYLIDIIDDAAEIIYEKFGWLPKNEKVLLEIYPDRSSFQLASGLTETQIEVSGAIGICRYNRMIIASPRILIFGYTWPDTVIHEYVHYVIAKITGLTNMPLWLNEGLATSMEEKWKEKERRTGLSPKQKNILRETAKDGNWVALEKMKHGMPNLDSRREVAVAFAQVQSMTEYIIAKYGWRSVKNLLEKLYDYPPQEAFNSVFEKSQEEIKNKWSKYISEKEIKHTDGALLESYALKGEDTGEVREWVSETAETDIRIARMFLERGSYEPAIRKYKDALNKEPGNSVIINELARAQVQAGKKEKAKRNLFEAVKNNPSYAPPYLHLGRILYNRRDFSEAEKMIKEYIYRSPFNPEAHRKLAAIKDKLGDQAGADRALEHAGMLK